MEAARAAAGTVGAGQGAAVLGGGAAGRGGASGGNSGGGSSGYNPCPTDGSPCGSCRSAIRSRSGSTRRARIASSFSTKRSWRQQKITIHGHAAERAADRRQHAVPEALRGHQRHHHLRHLEPDHQQQHAEHAVRHHHVHIGTNDMTSRQSPRRARPASATCSTSDRPAMPNALDRGGQDHPVHQRRPRPTTTYNNAIPGVVETRVAAGKHIIIVDLGNGLPALGMEQRQRPSQPPATPGWATGSTTRSRRPVPEANLSEAARSKA